MFLSNSEVFDLASHHLIWSKVIVVVENDVSMNFDL
jgi:hypothetical protein